LKVEAFLSPPEESLPAGMMSLEYRLQAVSFFCKNDRRLKAELPTSGY
jgi:hypothetical protein